MLGKLAKKYARNFQGWDLSQKTQKKSDLEKLLKISNTFFKNLKNLKKNLRAQIISQKI